MKRPKKPRKEAEVAEPAEQLVEPPIETEAALVETDAPLNEPAKYTPERNSARLETQLESIVKVHDGPESSWKEKTVVSTVSKNGAGFALSKPCTVGRLVSLVLPLPLSMRVYDHYEKLYPVLGLVQYCHETTVDGHVQHNVGVAFVGKRIPDSFRENPLQSYRVTGMSGDGLWTITERDTEFQQRHSPRFRVSIDVGIILLRRDRKGEYKEQSVTQDIGMYGAAVQCSLDADVGDRVKFLCPEYDFFAVATVRHRRQGNTPEHPSSLHLEFVEAKFPIEKLPAFENRAEGNTVPEVEGAGNRESV